MEEKTQSQAFLGTEPVGKLLFRLALPAIAAQLINVLYNIVDRVYLGHIPGVGGLALTGVGVCSPIILIISAFAALVSMGGAPLASNWESRTKTAQSASWAAALPFRWCCPWY